MLILNVCSSYGSFYTNEHRFVDANDVNRIVEKYDRSFVDDSGGPVSQNDIDSNQYHWTCADSHGIECTNCIPNGSSKCKGGLTYDALYGNSVESSCYCLLLKKDLIPTYVLYMNDGTDHYWNKLKYIDTELQPLHDDPSEYNCSIISKDYLRHKCFLEHDNTTGYFDANYELLLNSTYELLNAEESEFKTHVDRTNGKVVVYYGDLDTLYSFSDKMTYELKLSETYILKLHDSDARVEFTIPRESFWRNMTLQWKVSSSEQWLFGVFPLASGTVQWYPNSRPDDEILVDPCTRPCGAFCFRHPECMTDKQKNIKMGGFVTFFGSIYLFLVLMVFVWYDKRKKVVSVGGGNLSCGKRAFFCIAIVSLATPGNAWGTCTSSAFSQAKLLEHKNGIDYQAFSGNMYLSNVKGESCFDVRDPVDESKTLMQAVLQIEKAKVIYDLQPQYMTYSSDVRSIIDTKCPIALCSTISCDGICDGDRTCDGHLDVDQNFPGQSQCFEPQAEGNCVLAWSLITCQRQRTLVGYSIKPKQWYAVMKLANNPRLELHVNMTLDYLNGTTYSKTHIVSATEPNMIDPMFQIGDVEFFNNGISETNTDPAKSYVMIHEGLQNPGPYPISTDAAYFVEASPVGTKVKNKVGHLQCSSETRGNCDFADDLCTIDVTRSGHEVACGIDPVETDANKNNKMPVLIDGATYRLSKDLTTVEAELENIGSFNMFMNGETAFVSEIVNVAPQCELVGVANGCFMCTTGFWFKMKAKSTADAGQAIVSISSTMEGDTRDVGVFNKIVTLTNDYLEYDIHGFTEIENNNLLVTITSGENSCAFTMDFKAHFDDLTAIANRSKVYIHYQGDSDSVFDDIGNIFSDVGNFFSNFFGSMWGWLKWVLLVLGILLLFFFLGPCIEPLIAILIQSVGNIFRVCCRGTSKGFYSVIKQS